MNIKKLATTFLLLGVAASALAQDDRFAGVAIEADLPAFYNLVKDTSTTILVMKSQQVSVEEAVAEGLGDEYEPWGTGIH